MTVNNNWQPSDGIILEDNATEIVKNPNKNYAVTAGPGAGKTELLAQKASYILQAQQGFTNGKILAISFKRDARRNLAERVESRCGLHLSKKFHSYTYHSFAKSIVDHFGLAVESKYRLANDYEIAFDEDDAKFPKSITFDRLIKMANYIFKSNPKILSAFRSTYNYVFLDEFQDTTSDQYELIKTCFLGSNSYLTAVGDEKQRIMVWAGADVNVFNKFKNDFGAEEKNLLMNHRSAPRLVQLQKHLILKQQHQDVELEANKKWSADSGICQVLVFRNNSEEAKYLTNMITGLINEKNVPPEEICIIVKQKTNDYTNNLIRLLKENGVQGKVFDQIQDLLSEELMSLILSSIQSSLKKSPKDFSIVYSLYKEMNFKRVDVQPDREFFKEIDIKIGVFYKEVQDKISKAKTENDIIEVLNTIISFYGEDKIKNVFVEYKQGNRLENELTKLAKLIWEAHTATGDWLTTIDCVRGKDSVPMMTIHKSKGLEYKVVIFIGLEDSAFWSHSRNPNESQCAFFVALSRAKEFLYFTFSKERDFLRTNPQSVNTIKEFYDNLKSSGIMEIVKTYE